MIKRIAAFIMAAAVLCFGCINISAAEYTQTVLESYFSYFPSSAGWYDVYNILYDTMPTNGMYQMADGAGFGPCFKVDKWAKDAVYMITCDITYTLSSAMTNGNLSQENMAGRNLSLFTLNKPQKTTESGLTGSNSLGIDYSNLVNINFSPLTSTNSTGTYTCTQVITFSTSNGEVDNIDEKLWATFWTCFDQDGQFSYNNMTLSVIYNAEPSVYDLILEKLDEILTKLDSNQSNTNNYYQSIEQAVTEILTNQNTQINNESSIITNQQITNTKLDTTNNNLNTINNQLELLYEVGQDKNTPNIQETAKLKQTEKDLSDAEQTLEDKSKSLTQRASTGLTNSITASGQFISSVTPAVASVTSQITNAYQALPQDVQPMILSMPLLSFAVWLIGFKR